MENIKRVLGLDIGTNSVGWALIENDFDYKTGAILGAGTRIIPMGQDEISDYSKGVSISQTAERTGYRGVRRLHQRSKLRRERLHRVLNILGFLPQHYAAAIDFDQRLGQFKIGQEIKLNYSLNVQGSHEFIFMESFQEMANAFKKNGIEENVPHDWLIYFLRDKALNHKISKEELAWLILHFNQKRGYYQLRGEEESTEKNKRKEFMVLKVSSVEDTGEQLKNGTKLYAAIFENGWIYDKPVSKVENWLNQEKEFIVTTSLDKEGQPQTNKQGEVKRSFKKVDSEKDWIAIKEKTQREIEESGKSVGQYIFAELLINPKSKIKGGLIKTIERKFYKEEFEKILKEQIKHHPEINIASAIGAKNYSKCLKELYPKNTAHVNNIKGHDFLHLFANDIIFYQRPLKSKKSTISGCRYEFRTFEELDKETGELKKVDKPLQAISKSHPLFQEFRLWQFIHNLRLQQIEDEKGKLLFKDVTDEFLPDYSARVKLFDFLNARQEIDQKGLLRYFGIKGTQQSAYQWKYGIERKFPCSPTRAQFLNKLKNVKNYEEVNFLTPTIEQHLWHIIYSVKDREEYIKALGTFSEKYELDTETFVDSFSNFPPFASDYGAYSYKAINRLLPLMRVGRYWDEDKIEKAVVDNIKSILAAINELKIDGYTEEKEIKKKFEERKDKSIPKQLLRSFLSVSSLDKAMQGLNTYQACYAVYKRHSEVGNVQRWLKPQDIDLFLIDFKQHSLRNPIVEKILGETLRVVRDIWKEYGNGQENFFDEIHVELGRELKNSKEKRENIYKRNINNENTNQRIRALLQELKQDIGEEVKPFSPSQQEILKLYEEGVFQNPTTDYSTISEDEIIKIRKSSAPSKKEIERYKLWLEQGYLSPYTGNVIPLSRLFSIDYQIEHIIPQSRHFDDSLSNKVICESAINPDPWKGNKTAYEFMEARGGDEIAELSTSSNQVRLFTLTEYIDHCNSYFKKNKTKLQKLTSPDIPTDFIARQLNDSRYISKYAMALLSNVVREQDEQESTSKNLLPVTGAITAKLKHDWGLNDIWNKIIANRFIRLNELREKQTGQPCNDYGFWDDKDGKRFFRSQVPEEISRGFKKKRIDHRHHALDAILIACMTRLHIHYLNALNNDKEKFDLKPRLFNKNKKGKYSKYFQSPWPSFQKDTIDCLTKVIVSFKKDVRVIKKANNKTWQWIEKDGVLKKELVRQTKGDHWSIRKPLHKETVAGKLNLKAPKGKIISAVRTELSAIKNQKHLDKIADSGVQNILIRHLQNYTDEKGNFNFEEAFNQTGVVALNANIKELNSGKNHQPIYKVRISETGSKFPVGQSGNKSKKYVEAAKGTNLFFAVYWNEKKNRRVFETIPLNEVIEHQKQEVHLPNDQKTKIPIREELGRFLYYLSPNDLVFVPTGEHLLNRGSLDLDKIDPKRVYKMVSSSGSQCFFVRNDVATSIHNKLEFSALNKMEKDLEGQMIKSICFKLQVNRLGHILNYISGEYPSQ